MSNEEVVLISRDSYDELAKAAHTLEEIRSNKRVPVQYIYHAYKADILSAWHTENEILKATLAKNEGLARRNEKLEKILTRTQSKAPSLKFKLLIGLALAAYTALLIIVF